MPTPYASPAGATPDAFGAGVGEAIGQGASALGQLYQQEKQKADTSAVMGAIAQGKLALNDIILDPEKGYAATKGDDALAQRKTALEKYDQALGQAAATLKNDDQRRLFEGHRITLSEQGYTHAISHESVQIEHLALAKFQGAADQTVRALQQPGVIADPVALDQQLKDLENIAHGEALRRFGGHPGPEAVQAIVGPTMQKGGLDAMEAAVASQDPAIAQRTLQRVGPLLGTHERFYAATVLRMTATKEIAAQAGALVGSGLTPVVMPGGQQTARLDPGKVAEGIAKLAPDNPFRDEIVAATEKRTKSYSDAWTHSVAQVSAGALTAGTNSADGKFDISKVSPAALEWLRQNAPDKLIALGKEDARAQRAASGQDRVDSSYNKDNLMWQMADPVARLDVFGPMSAERFQDMMLDEKRFPNGFTPQDSLAVRTEFRKIKAEAGKTQERTTSIAKQQIEFAFDGQPDDLKKKYLGPIVQELDTFVASETKRNNGKAPDDAAIRERADFLLAHPPKPHWWSFADPRRIEAITQAQTQAAQLGVQAATPVAPQRFYRYSKDRKTRFPSDAQGNVVGPGEPAP